jgi:hypothetical protein
MLIADWRILHRQSMHEVSVLGRPDRLSRKELFSDQTRQPATADEIILFFRPVLFAHLVLCEPRPEWVAKTMMINPVHFGTRRQTSNGKYPPLF